MNLWLTSEETIAAIADLEPRTTLTIRQVRYWDSEGLIPAARVHVGGARLYGPDDVALLRLALRLLASGRSLRQVSEALRYRSVAIREAFHSGRLLALTFGPRGVADVVPVSTVPAGADAFDLRACFTGVVDAMRAQRKEEPGLWTGWRFERPSQVEVAAAI